MNPNLLANPASAAMLGYMRQGVRVQGIHIGRDEATQQWTHAVQGVPRKFYLFKHNHQDDYIIAHSQSGLMNEIATFARRHNPLRFIAVYAPNFREPATGQVFTPLIINQDSMIARSSERQYQHFRTYLTARHTVDLNGLQVTKVN